MMMKGLKSLQLRLNELIPRLDIGPVTVSNMAYSKARLKLKHTAFIALNQAAVVKVMYSDGDYHTYKSFRVLGIDGSKIRLPDLPALEKEFGTRSHSIPAKPGEERQASTGTHCFAQASVCYDVLNRIALDARLESITAHEYTVAGSHLRALALSKSDLVMEDRGYHNYRMFASVVQAGAHFLIRCKRGSGMRVVDELLAGKGAPERIETITLPARLAEREEYRGLPMSLTVRFVRIILDNGTVEALATSVLDQQLTIEDLKQLYHLRWEVETFYGILKTRLNLENFSGISPEAIRQDFFATVFLTGVESIFIQDSEQELSKQRAGYSKKVNKAVSFNAIKYRAFELFYSKEPKEQVLAELDKLFTTSPTLVRKDRVQPRKVHPDRQVLRWYKERRKGVF